MRIRFVFALFIVVGLLPMLNEAEAQVDRSVVCVRSDGETIVSKRRCRTGRGEVRLNFDSLIGEAGPAGEQGEAGPQGENGEQGPAGLPG